MTESILLAAETPLLARVIVFLVCILVGAMLIFAGRYNIASQTYEETGKRRKINRALGRSNVYRGKKAVRMGITRIVMGVVAIIFGFVFLIFGAFLADLDKKGGQPQQTETVQQANSNEDQMAITNGMAPPPPPVMAATDNATPPPADGDSRDNDSHDDKARDSKAQPGSGTGKLSLDFGKNDHPASEEPARRTATIPDTPSIALPSVTYIENRIRPSQQMGNDGKSKFVDRAPPGGILVGAVLMQGENWGGALQALQPIYQVQNEFVRGQVCGVAGGTEFVVLAKPGHALAGLRVRAGLVLDAVQLAFAPLEGNRLNLDKAYFAQWVGSKGGRSHEFFANGHALAGFFGSYEKDLRGLGVLVIDQLSVDDTTGAEPSAERKERTWTSANGKFTVVATLVEVDDGEVVLRKTDGSTLRVAFEKLSDADRKFISDR